MLRGLLAAVLVLLASCGKEDPARVQPGRARGASEHLVSVVTVTRATLSTTHERPGSLRYRRLVRVFNQEEGRITELGLFEGDRVKKGQLLVALDDALLQAERDKARATLAQTRLDLERLEDLRGRRAVSESEVSLARTALRVAEADVRVLETRLGFTRIQAPFAGVVVERLAEPGDFVSKNTQLLTLADPQSLIAEVYASELILPQLRVGDPAKLRIDALGDQAFEARILRIHPRLEESSRQGIVELTLAPIPAGARAGQFVRATLRTAGVARLLVPFRALRRDREGEFVWLMDEEDKAVRRSVRSGLQIGEDIEIRDGVEPGDRVVTRGFLGLSQGKSVKIPNQPEIGG
ncbi:efflux transporter periplasmic adaptor subunit [Thiocystis violacea]|nr:efflux transporter periplasmic adaptor subunit [Thiocystis violacea]